LPRSGKELLGAVMAELEMTQDEADLYVAALTKGRLEPAAKQERAVADELLAKGMFIVEARGGAYLPVHPRLALSNYFRAYEERMIRKRKEKRLAIDRLTLELIPLYEDSKDRNHGGAGGLPG
jgi:hypothetical protein